MNYEHIQYEVEGPVATITLNRPKAFNALLPQMEDELHDALRRADNDRAVRASISYRLGNRILRRIRYGL